MSKLRSRSLVAILIASARSSSFPTAGIRLMCASPLKTAARLKCLSFGMRLLSLLPQSNGRLGSRPRSGICLFAKL
jgi:hypothetical protein